MLGLMSVGLISYQVICCIRSYECKLYVILGLMRVGLMSVSLIEATPLKRLTVIST